MRPTSVARPCVTSVGSLPSVRSDVQLRPPSMLFQRSPLLKCPALVSLAQTVDPVPGEGGRTPTVAPTSVGQAYTPLASHCERPAGPVPRYWISQTLSRVSGTVGSLGRSTSLNVVPPSIDVY